ncbi:MAG: hypothetical protein Q7O66_19845 [Dehalococcoidia bacterium]|nr:hypothetical protein [Dehalococcoidia bacterium]
MHQQIVDAGLAAIGGGTVIENEYIRRFSRRDKPMPVNDLDGQQVADLEVVRQALDQASRGLWDPHGAGKQASRAERLRLLRALHVAASDAYRHYRDAESGQANE